jgi:S-adenosylmethionine decarboxylase
MKTFNQNKGKTTLGMHLMLDAYGASKKDLDDMKRIYKFLYRLPEMIGMHRLTSPMVVNADESASGRDPGGISGVVLIAESHISIHTFAKRGFFTFDMYSCSNFNQEIDKVLEYIFLMFPYKKKEIRVIKRGTSYPATNIV